MRILHLYFQLHLPHQLNLSGKHKSDLFHDAETFTRANETEYQPFFALLERNSQKFPEFKISLGVSGQWFDQAEKYNPELIQRLKKLINLGRVQIVALPYDFSLAWFYDQAEFEAQIRLFNQKIRDYFGIECSTFAMPELMYNDKIAKWAEKSGYSGVLIGEAESVLDWRTPNRVYEAKGCKDLRLICQNTKFSSAILQAKDSIMEFDDKTGQKVFSLPKFQKELDLEFLRGDLINLCLDTTIFRRLREQGIIKFFDTLISEWLSVSQNRFYNALEAIGSSQPKAEVSIKTTIMRRNLHPKTTDGIVLAKKIRYCPPEGLNSPEQTKFEETLYALRDQVQKTKNENVVRDFSRLTALDYVTGINSKTGNETESLVKLPQLAELSEILTNFGQKVFSLMPRPAELAETAGPSRVDPPKEMDDFAIKVHRVENTKKPKSEDEPTTKSGAKEQESKNVKENAKHTVDRTPGKPANKPKTPAPDTIFGGVTFGKPIEADNDEDAALDRYARVEIDLAELPEAELVEDAANESGKDKKKPEKAQNPRPKRTKHRRVVIE